MREGMVGATRLRMNVDGVNSSRVNKLQHLQLLSFGGVVFGLSPAEGAFYDDAPPPRGAGGSCGLRGNALDARHADTVGAGRRERVRGRPLGLCVEADRTLDLLLLGWRFVPPLSARWPAPFVPST